MKTFSKSMLAVTGLALSLAACGPGLQGEGTKKPNVARLLKIQDKADAKAVAALPNIKSISLGEADEDEILVKIELDNVADLEDKQKSVDGLVSIKGETVTDVDAVKGKENTYNIKLQCLENCTMIAGILDTSVNTAQPTEEIKVADDSKKEENEDEELFSAQSGTTAPEAKLNVPAKSSDSVRTGVVVSATGEILKAKVLDVESSVEESIEELKAEVSIKKNHGLLSK